MTDNSETAESSNAVEISRSRLAEDPNRQPHEKETAFHVKGDGSRFSVTSFKKVFYGKLLRRPEFDVNVIHLLDREGHEHTAKSRQEVVEKPGMTVIGVYGSIPVGAVNIGTPRNSNSHADLVK